MEVLPRFWLAATALTVAAHAGEPRSDLGWTEYLGGPERSHYSTLTQITPQNVTKLQRAWEYRTGDPGEMQCNPLVIGDTLYGTTASGSVFALDAATGQERWRFTPVVEKTDRTLRGVAHWSDGTHGRIFFGADEWLYAVDARTGQPVADFGTEGRTSLKAGLGERAARRWVVSTTPGTVFENLIVMPIRVTEQANAAPGYIQAFDVRTGKLAWTFKTIPDPGQPGYETWPKDAHQSPNIGGANSWSGMSIDRKRGLLFAPTGSASPDFWGGERIGANLYANCLLALDARTGQLKWHFQFVHHDLWDRDLPAPPNLVTVQHNGKKIDAVAQVTKSGHLYVFDRETGESLFPIEERPVPKSGLKGEETWPTQPFPKLPLPFSRQEVTVDDISPYAENREELATQFRHGRSGTYEPFGLHDTILVPGFDGGAEWGGAAVDPSGVMYVNTNEIAWMVKLQESVTDEALRSLSPGHRVYARFCIGCHGPERKGNPTSGFPSLVGLAERKPRDAIVTLINNGKGMMPGFNWIAEHDQQLLVDFLLDAEKVEPARDGKTADPRAVKGPTAPYEIVGYVKFIDKNGYPGIKPPWGALTAIDLNTGQHLWRVTLGEFKELTAKGIPQTGTENYGGPVITASGVLFIAGTKDSMLRAYEMKTGKLLWETELPASAFATPATYSVRGRQYVVVAAGGKKMGTKPGDSYVAYALPEEKPR